MNEEDRVTGAGSRAGPDSASSTGSSDGTRGSLSTGAGPGSLSTGAGPGSLSTGAGFSDVGDAGSPTKVCWLHGTLAWLVPS